MPGDLQPKAITVPRGIDHQHNCHMLRLTRTAAQTAQKRSFRATAILQKLSPQTREKIEKQLASDTLVVYMKGTADFPRCGFSKAVIDVLKASAVKFTTVDVLQDDIVREGIKEFSDWPTIPQVYLKGEFVGGCDIVLSYHKDGSLAQMLSDAGVEAKE